MPRHLDPADAKANMIARKIWPISDWPKGANQWLSVCMVCGEFVTPRYRNVMQPGRGGCDPCAKLARAKSRRIPQGDAIETMRRAGVEPLEKYRGCDKPWRCLCLNHSCPGLWMGDPADIRPTLSWVRDSRRASVSACKYCAGTAIRPERARQKMIERGVTPLVEYTSAWWRWRSMCLRCERVVWPRYANVVLNGQGGCDYCGGTMRVQDEQARSEMMAAGAQPLVRYPGVNNRWKCKCLAPECPGPDSRVIYPRLGSIRNGGQACKWCAGVVIDAETARWTMIDRAGLVPVVDYPGVRVPWKCYCARHNGFVYPTLGSVNSRGSGCVECAESGFKKEKPALVYLVTNKRLNAAKVGICNEETGRIERHTSRGWVLYDIERFAEGRHAAQVEREVIAEWRARGWEAVRDCGAPYDGWTETVLLTSDATAESLWTDVISYAHL